MAGMLDDGDEDFEFANFNSFNSFSFNPPRSDQDRWTSSDMDGSDPDGGNLAAAAGSTAGIITLSIAEAQKPLPTVAATASTAAAVATSKCNGTDGTGPDPVLVGTANMNTVAASGAARPPHRRRARYPRLVAAETALRGLRVSMRQGRAAPGSAGRVASKAQTTAKLLSAIGRGIHTHKVTSTPPTLCLPLPTWRPVYVTGAGVQE